MPEWADAHGRFLFAPNALVDADPYIDRLQIECDTVALPLLPYRYAQAFIDELGRGSVFTRPFKGSTAVRKRGWLFGGTIQARRPTGGASGTRLIISLMLNPTRFLQAHGVPHAWNERQAMLSDPSEALRARGRAHAALDAASSQTLDLRSNFLAHEPFTYGRVREWPVRTREYAEVVCRLLENEFTRVFRRVLAAAPRIDLTDQNWRVRQVECYWEFRTRDALQKVASVSRTARQVLRDSYAADFPPREGSERNAPYVSGHLDHENIRAKLYAKTAQVVRFEIAYDKSPLTSLRRRPAVEGRGSISHAVGLLTPISDDAKSRAVRFWNEFWRRHDGRGLVTPEQLLGFLRHIEWAAQGTRLSADQLLSLLILSDGGEPFEAGRGGVDPLKRLVRRGVLRARPGSPPRRVRYAVTTQCRDVVAGLRELFDREKEVGELQRDEDPVVPRLRVRSYGLQEPPPRPSRSSGRGS